MSDRKRQDEAVLSVEGSFDPYAAYKLREELSAHHGAAPVTLDFHAAREIHDLGIAVLAYGLVGDHVSARFRGLSQHHERILRYLGFDTSSAEQFAESVGHD